MCTYTAPLFTEVARGAGFAIPVGAAMITSFNILGKPLMGLIFLAFLSQNPILIGIAIAVYLVCFVLYKKNRPAIDNYLERMADKNVTVDDEFENAA